VRSFFSIFFFQHQKKKILTHSLFLLSLSAPLQSYSQVKYVVELAKALSRHPAVHRVDLLTRLVADPRVDPEYSEPVEVLVPPRIPTQQSAGGGGGGAASPGKTSFDANAASSSSTTTNNNNNASTPTAAGGPDAAAANAAALGGAYIVRLRAGPPTRYLRKERLWPHVREFADCAISHVRSTLAALSDAGAPCELYCVHGHYADAGEAAALMAATLGVDMVITGEERLLFFSEKKKKNQTFFFLSFFLSFLSSFPC